MKPSVLTVLAAASIPLAACASTPETAMESPEPAPLRYQSAAAGPRDCAAAPTSALVGSAVGGLDGAIWADADNDGCVDGYMREGRYYGGAPTVQPLPADYRSGG